MRDFKGRDIDLDRLGGRLAEVRNFGRGQALILTGRRRVGKSRLVQEFCDRTQLPYVVFQATRGRSPAAERADFIEAVAQSELPNSELLEGITVGDWNQALRALALAAPDDTPSVAVIDEIPWLAEQDGEFEGALQTIWDRFLAAKPLLLILIGSDLSVMEALQQYGRPFFGRAARMTLRPLNPADVRLMTGLPAAEAMDAHLITGGFPEVVRRWEPGMSRTGFLRRGLCDPLSPLLMAGELSLAGEFPEPTATRRVLEAIGTGERNFAAIASAAGAAGPLVSGTLSPILADLTTKNVISADLPLSTKPDGRNKRYRVTDSYLRFWLTFLRRGIAESERGRGDLVLARIERAWQSWRGRAVEPLIRESLARMLPDDRWADVQAVAGWWNRRNNPEVDLIGADRGPVAGRIVFAGSIKWQETRTFGGREYNQLAQDAVAVPGAGSDTPLVAVSRSGFRGDLLLSARWGPEDLVAGWS